MGKLLGPHEERTKRGPQTSLPSLSLSLPKLESEFNLNHFPLAPGSLTSVSYPATTRCPHDNDKDNARVCEMIQSWVWSLRSPQTRSLELAADTPVLQARGSVKWEKGLWEPGLKEGAWELGG